MCPWQWFFKKCCRPSEHATPLVPFICSLDSAVVLYSNSSICGDFKGSWTTISNFEECSGRSRDIRSLTAWACTFEDAWLLMWSNSEGLLWSSFNSSEKQIRKGKVKKWAKVPVDCMVENEFFWTVRDPSQEVGGWGWGLLPLMAYTRRLCLKWVPFLSFRYMKGWGFHLLKYKKR